jgi:hypothetical protein
MIALVPESSSPAFDQRPRNVIVEGETDAAWFGRPANNPDCPSLEWPKFAWRRATAVAVRTLPTAAEDRAWRDLSDEQRGAIEQSFDRYIAGEDLAVDAAKAAGSDAEALELGRKLAAMWLVHRNAEVEQL